MPITEIVRVIATASGTAEGRAVQVDLVVDTDGRFGRDADAVGFPVFWLRYDSTTIGPFKYEDEAVTVAAERFAAVFY